MNICGLMTAASVVKKAAPQNSKQDELVQQLTGAHKALETQAILEAQQIHNTQPQQFVRPVAPKRKAMSQKLRIKIHQRDRCCQFVNTETGVRCGTTHFLNIDHIQPIWAGGGNEESNLRILCSAHNRYRYRVGR